MNLNPGTNIYYTKDDIKHYGKIIYVDEDKNIYRISLVGIGDTLEVEEDEVEEAPGGGGGISIDIVVGWKAGTEPDVTKIPTGVSVVYQGTTYIGTKAASEDTKGQIVLVSITDGSQPNLFSEYVTYKDGNTYGWEMIGTTEVNLNGYARQIVIEAASNKTVNGYQVPALSDAQLLAIYNGVVAGDSVVVTDAAGMMHFEGINADMVSGEVFITFRYFDKMVLEYAEGNVTNFYPLMPVATLTLYEVGSTTPVSYKICAEEA